MYGLVDKYHRTVIAIAYSASERTEVNTPSLVWVPLEEEVPLGTYADGVTVRYPTQDLASIITQKMEQVSRQRKLLETGGVLYHGVRIQTDTESQMRLKIVTDALRRGITQSVSWRGENGEYIILDTATAEDLATKVFLFVQACFDTERSHLNQLRTIKDILHGKTYDPTTGWPSTTLGS